MTINTPITAPDVAREGTGGGGGVSMADVNAAIATHAAETDSHGMTDSSVIEGNLLATATLAVQNETAIAQAPAFFGDTTPPPGGTWGIWPGSTSHTGSEDTLIATDERLYLSPIVSPVDVTLDQVIAHVESTGSLMRVGLFDPDQSDIWSVTEADLIGATTLDVSSSGDTASASGLDWELEKGHFYWAGMICDGTVTLLRSNAQPTALHNWKQFQAAEIANIWSFNEFSYGTSPFTDPFGPLSSISVNGEGNNAPYLFVPAASA